MKREIKFRAWDNTNKTMLSVGRYFDIDNSGVVYQVAVGNPTDNEELLLMQFTGLTDRHGVEIYEGDVVNAHDKVVALISFEQGSWWLGSIDRLFIHDGGLEVIGNIYENPELLATPNKKGNV